MASTDVSNLTSGRLLARNTIINLAGEAMPFLVAIFAIPVLVHSLGIDRYGVLTLSMMVVGYFGLFDFGLGSAATKFIAEAAASGDHSNIPGLFWTSLYLMLVFGTAGAILVAALAPWLVLSVLKIPPAFQPESLHAFYLLAFAMPIVISGGSLNGTLSAYQRFDLINAVRVPFGIFSYLGPLIVLPFSHSVAWMVAVMVVGRLASWSVSFALCQRIVPALSHDLRPSRVVVRPMLSFGGWVTVARIVGPIMVYFDRFLIGAMLSMAAVAYYAVPYQVATKLWIIPAAVTGVTFPAFSGIFSRDPARSALMLESATKYIILALFPPVLLIITLAPEGLSLWLGPSFAHHSTTVLRWLTLAVFINSVAHPTYGLIQAAHRPDLIAKLHIAELPFYLLLLWWMLLKYGVVGVAIAWTVRVVATTAIVLVMARVLLPVAVSAIRRAATIVSAASLVLALGTMPMTLVAKGLFLGAVLLLFVPAIWLLLEPRERYFVRDCLCRARVLSAEPGR